MRRLIPPGLLPLVATLSLCAPSAHADAGLALTDLTQGDPFFYTRDQLVKDDDGQKTLVGTGRPDKTHSAIPHLPVYLGYMQTNYTYRFVSVAEQVLTMIGEGKHGLWRVQEAGTVRLYRRKDATGLPGDADPSAPQHVATVLRDYDAYLPDESWAGYKYPDERVNAAGRLNFVDVPITHAKFDGRYARHEPIDLANFFCTMSEDDFPYAKQAMNFAFNQPGANRVGPLGRRAGLDVRENYRNVLRLDAFPDARAWVNVGQPGQDALHVRWRPVDTRKTAAEYYLAERPFFNKPYLFLIAVFDNADNDDFRYVRPHGPYFEQLGGQQAPVKTAVTAAPRFHLEDGGVGKAVGLPIYGVHHPNRAAFKAGGACPLRGGDWGRYPKTSGGSGWATQYEEVTPICDAVLLDIKFYSNLDGRNWNDADKYLANAGRGSRRVTYRLEPGEYGRFTDPYHTERGVTNAESRELPGELTLTFPSVEPPVAYNPTPPATRVAGASAGVKSCRPVQ